MSRDADGCLHYARHFVLLSALAAVLAATRDWRPSFGPAASFGFYGALHASAVAACVRRTGWWRGGAFIALSAALAALIATAGIRGARLLPLQGLNGIALVLIATSGSGALGYGLLVRHFCMDLSLRALVFISLGCMAAVLLCLMAEAHFGSPGSLGLAVGWWFAFSAGLRCASRGCRSGVPPDPVP